MESSTTERERERERERDRKRGRRGGRGREKRDILYLAILKISIIIRGAYTVCILTLFTHPPKSWLSAGSPLCSRDEQMAECPPEAAQWRQLLPLVS